jgi:DNA modification methylase
MNWEIRQGDSLALLPTVPTASVDAIVTDPPYAISVPGSVHRHSGKGSRSFDFFPGDEDWPRQRALVRAVLAESIRVLKPTGSMYWWCGHRQFGDIVDGCEGAGFRTRFVVWSKACPAPAPPWSGWPSGAELCVYAFRPGRVWNYGPGCGPRSNVLVADSYRFGQPGKEDHPTQKPLAIIEPLILGSTHAEDLVLDPFMGTGTVGVVAMRHGRRFLGLELNPDYCAIARRRIAGPLFAQEPA